MNIIDKDKLDFLKGKTIEKVEQYKSTVYDDTGYLKITFTNGEHVFIESNYDTYTGESEDEYPTGIEIHPSTGTDFDPFDELDIAVGGDL